MILTPSMVAEYLATRGREKPVNPKSVDPKELAMGIKVEMEHANNREIAKVIALQHLHNRHYYSEGKKIGLFDELAKAIPTISVVLSKSSISVLNKALWVHVLKKKKKKRKPTWNVENRAVDPNLGGSNDPGLV